MYYIYRFLDKSKNVIYVGKSKQDLEQRFKGHSHLPDECYNSVHKIEFISCSTETDMNIKEIYYINKYNNGNGYFNLLDVADIPKSVEFNDKWKMYRGSLPSHFSKSINYRKGYTTKKETRFNKDGSVDRRKSNKIAGESSYVEALTKDEVKLIIEHLIKCVNSASNNEKTKIWYRNLVMFVLHINIPLKTNEFTNLKYKDVFDKKDKIKDVELKLSRFHKDNIINVPLKNDIKKMLEFYRQIYGYSYSVNANDFLFMSRKNQAVTNISWGRIIKDSADAVGIKKNVNSESIRKTYGLNIYKTSKNKLQAIQFLGEIWGQQREAQIIKYLDLLKTEVDFEFFFGEKFSLCEIDLASIDFLNNYIYLPTKNSKTSKNKEQANAIVLNKEQKSINTHNKAATIKQNSQSNISQNSNKNKSVIKSKNLSKEKKLQIINKYLSGESTQKALAIEYNVTVSSISRWVNDYKKYGEDVIQ